MRSRTLTLEGVLEVALLRGRELVVEDDGGVAQVVALGGQLAHLALADVVGGRRPLPALDGAPHHLGAGGVRELGQLVQRALGVPAAVRAAVLPLDRHQVGPLHRLGGDVRDFGYALNPLR